MLNGYDGFAPPGGTQCALKKFCFNECHNEISYNSFEMNTRAHGKQAGSAMFLLYFEVYLQYIPVTTFPDDVLASSSITQSERYLVQCSEATLFLIIQKAVVSNIKNRRNHMMQMKASDKLL